MEVVFSMVGESASLFLSMFWKMSSALKDCQQVFEAGTLESDRKRAFGLFFSPRNPAPLANPWQLRFYFFTSLWERRNKTRRGRGCWCLPLAWAPGLGTRGGRTSLPVLLLQVLMGTSPSSPKQQGTPSQDLQSLWSGLQLTWPSHITPGGKNSL